MYVREFEFFVSTMKQIASIFCNVSFAGQYSISPAILLPGYWIKQTATNLSKSRKHHSCSERLLYYALEHPGIHNAQ